MAHDLHGIADMQLSPAPRFIRALVDAASTRPFLNDLLALKRQREDISAAIEGSPLALSDPPRDDRQRAA